MPATGFIFRHRFWLIGAIFWAGFACYFIDHANAGRAMGVWIAQRTGGSAKVSIRVIFVIGAVLAVLAAALRTWASAYLDSRVVHDRRLHSERLVADGPYRFVRNPLYLGTILVALGMGPMASRLGFVVLVLGNLLISYGLILSEEAELRASQGESYRRYLQRVPRLLPSLAPLVESSGARPRWAQAFVGESFIWAFAVAGLTYAVTLNLRFWYVPMIASLPLYFVTSILLKRRARNAERQSSAGGA